MLAAVMVDMRCPEPADTMRGPVKDVIEKVVQDKTGNPCPPGPGYRRDAKVVTPHGNGKHCPAKERPCNRAPGTQRQRRQRVAWFIFFRRVPADPQHFKNDQQDEEGNGIVDRAEQFFGHVRKCRKPEAQYCASLPRFNVTRPNVRSPVPTVRKL